MKVKLGQLLGLASRPGQPGPMEQLVKNTAFSARLSYRIAKLARAVQAALDPLQDARSKLIDKHGTVHKGDRDKSVQLGDKAWRKFVKEHDQLISEEVDIDVQPVELPPEADGVTAEMLMALDGFVSVKGEK